MTRYCTAISYPMNKYDERTNTQDDWFIIHLYPSKTKNEIVLKTHNQKHGVENVV
jgi:hypothetical protein